MFIAEPIECTICTHKWVAVYADNTDKLECPNCGYFNETETN